MKKILISFFFIAFSSGVSAQSWFYVQANCMVNRTVAKCSVYNRWYRPITCRVETAAQTYYGTRGFTAKTVIVAPGFVDGVSVFALNPVSDPIVRSNASAYCRF